jgi:hypothetical protein
MGNFLNLVFDVWDGDNNPVPNLSHLNIKLEGEYIQIPHLLVNLPNPLVTVRKCNLNDVNSDGRFFYVINHLCAYENLFNENGWQIPQHIENCVRDKNLNIIFFNEHESFKSIEVTLRNLTTLLRKKDLNPKQFHIISNNSLLKETKIKINTEINVSKINYLLECISRDNEVKITEDDIVDDKKFIFLCHNRRPKTHRTDFLILLNRSGLLDSEIVDWSLTYGLLNDYIFDTKNFSSIEYSEDDFDFLSYPKLSFYESNKDWFSDINKYSAWKHLDLTTFQQSYFNIVTESHFDIDDVHMSEKTFKPFYYFQLPLFLASYRHVELLKQEHDLFLFDDLIDHSYDKERDYKKRLNMVISEIIRLSKMKDEIKRYYVENKSKLISNHNYIANYHTKNYTNKVFGDLTLSLKLI